MVNAQDIKVGLAQHQFCLHYQPKFSLTHNRVEGSEALIRWRQPDGSFLPPSEFISLAEQSSLIKQISTYIVTALLDDVATLNKAHLTPVSFNLTARDFEDDVLTCHILEAAAIRGIACDQIEVEITEGDSLDCNPAVLDNVHRLRAAGIGLAMDDYGVGYSSVDTLSRWPFSTIKIDQGLVSRMLASDKNARIVHSAIRMAHELGMDVVAEGVETDAQLRFLLEAGCSKVQGYLISKPLPLADIAGLAHPDAAPATLPVGQIHLAIIDHIQWRRRLLAFTLTRATLPPGAPERLVDPFGGEEVCLLEHWHRTEGRIFSHLPQYQEIGLALAFLSNLGKRLRRRIGEGAGPADLAEDIQELQQGSLEMLDILTTLENDVLAGMGGDGTGKATSGRAALTP